LLSAVLLERWPQVCRVKLTFANLATNRFVSTTKISMKCDVNWIPLRIRVCSRNNQPHLKVGLGISQTNADSQWNLVYNAFHRNLVVETKQFIGSTVNVIFSRQTGDQRSSKAAESKRQAIGNYFSE